MRIGRQVASTTAGAALLTGCAFAAKLVTGGAFDIMRGAPQLIDQLAIPGLIATGFGKKLGALPEPGVYALLFAVLWAPLYGIASTLLSGKDRARRTALASLLVAPATRPDAWQRLAKLTAFVGREAELARLNAFAQRHTKAGKVTWQVLCGPHGVGKSRLAREWLLRLKAEGWTVGFLSDTPDFDAVAAGRTTGPTVIVVDDAAQFGDAVWAFIDHASATWGAGRHEVRILLLAHADMRPDGADFARDERVRDARERTWLSDGLNRDGAPLVEVSAPPIAAGFLADDQQRISILRAAAAAEGETLSEVVARRLASEAGGRTVFLILAGQNPDKWRGLFGEYARNIVRTAQELFKSRPGTGERVLALSALIGPVDHEVRERVAPGAWPAEKLAELFSIDLALASREVPNFPDLLGHEIFFACLPDLQPGDRRALCAQLAGERPDAFLEKALGFWQNHADPSALRDLVTGAPATASAQRAEGLELLYAAAADVSPRRINMPFGRLHQLRGRTLMRALCDDAETLSADQCAKIVDAALKLLPEDATAVYLPALHAAAPCQPETRLKWAALLHRYETPVGSEPPAAIQDLVLKAGPLSEVEAAGFEQALSGPSLFERVFAAYNFAEALRNRRTTPEKIIPRFRAVREGLANLLRASHEAERVAGANAFAFIARDPRGSPGLEHLNAAHVRALRDLLMDERCAAQTAVAATLALGNAYRDPYRTSDVTRLLSPQSAVESTFTPAQEADRTDIAQILGSILRRGGLVGNDAWLMTLSRTRLGDFCEEVTTALIHEVGSPTLSTGDLQEVLVRASRRPSPLTIRLLAQAARTARPDEQAVALAGLAEAGAAGEIAALGGEIELRRTPFDLKVFAAEVRDHVAGGAWVGRQVEALREMLNDINVSNSGHLVHKLKAKDTTGRWAYYFVLVEEEREDAFLTAIDVEKKGTIDLEDYGEVIASCYGEAPTPEIVNMLREKYGFEV
jgi:hypothetical protein